MSGLVELFRHTGTGECVGFVCLFLVFKISFHVGILSCI